MPLFSTALPFSTTPGRSTRLWVPGALCPSSPSGPPPQGPAQAGHLEMKGARTETAGRNPAAGVKGGGRGDLVRAGSLFGKTTTLPSLSLDICPLGYT